MKNLILLFSFFIFITACSQTVKTGNDSLYAQIGGKAKVSEIVDNFMYEIETTEIVYQRFKETNPVRLRKTLNEFICVKTGGGCTYSGDDMKRTHAGMHISDTEFNRTVEMLIAAMTDADVPHRLQNKVLAIFAPMRKDIINQ